MNANWSKTSLGELRARGQAEIQTGPFGTVLKAAEYSAQGVPVVSVGEIRHGYIEVHKTTPRVPEAVQQRLPQFLLEEGDVVFGRKGGIDRNALIGPKESGWFLGSDGIRLRLSGALNSSFVSYQFRSPAVGKWLLGNSSGSIMPSLNEGVLGRLPLWLPELDEQERIASVLAALDAKIDLNNRINAELEALAKTIYDYWFVQFDFPDAHGRPYKSSGGAMVWNDTLKREIPAGWCVLTIGDVILKQPKALKVPASSVQTNGSTPVIDQSTDFICGYTDEADARIEIETPHVVFGDHTRIVKLVCFDYARGADGTQVLVPNTELVAPFAFFQSIARVDLSNYGYARHFKFLKSAHIVVPEISLANGYDEVVRPLFTSVEGNRRQNRELTQLRDWLLPLLMNGQVRVA